NLEEDAPAAAARMEFVIAEAVVALVERRCAQTPVALLVDDLQWADSGTLMVIHRLCQAIGQVPLLVVAARRPVPCGEDLVRLLRSLDARRVPARRLAPLDPGSVADLVQHLLGARAGGDLLDLVAGAHGNPFFVSELVKALTAEQGSRSEG